MYTPIDTSPLWVRGEVSAGGCRARCLMDAVRHSCPAQAEPRGRPGVVRQPGLSVWAGPAHSPDARYLSPMPLVVSVSFMPTSILAVILGCLGLAEHLGRVGCFTIGSGGSLMPGGGPLMLAPAPRALVAALLVVRHSTEASQAGICAARSGGSAGGWVSPSNGVARTFLA